MFLHSLSYSIYFFLQNRVKVGSLQHIIPIIIAIGFGIFFINYAKHNFSEKQQVKALHYFAIILSLTIIIYHCYLVSFGNYNIQTDLPLYLCSLIALLIPMFTYYRKYWMFEILVFWIIAGTTQAIITPDIADGFPNPDYFRYWIIHLGLVIVILYAAIVFNMQPKLRSVFKSFLALQIYVLIIVLINFALKANYFYLNKKPESRSVLDYFGEWPYYIIIVQILIIPCFLIVYLAFNLLGKIKKVN